ncbi:MAG TPA: pirin family protein [Candidatus Kapabacteria bacterium]|nr:pirin family protein [Candidatus Kapabacteria bacterium]
MIETAAAPKLRTLERLIEGQLTIEGGGFTVRRPFPTRAIDHVDPFLLLDEAGPIERKPGQESGLSDHPHRGFETLTYILEGDMESHDSTGFKDIFQAGDVEWTTAGRGIVHGGGPPPDSKFPHMHGFQIWVNLPKSKKWIEPKSQRITSAQIPTIENSERGYTVKVLGGNAEGAVGPVKTTWPVLYLHYILQPGGRVTLDVPKDINAMLYVFHGSVMIGNDERVKEGELGILSDGDRVEFSNASDSQTELLVLGGKPIGEPVARYGPFVMNEREEVFQAFDDYNAGKFV